ncbi:MAG: hypothetical protein K2H20_01560, partial [Bacilli bacterium]|nr:hypothetical protein [Bacilli bacterium]
MKNNILTASPEMKSEYCAQVVKIGELKPIEGSDYLAQTLVSGISMVVRKDEFKTGDYAIYCKNETALNKDFLSVNNLYEQHEYMRNSNKDYVTSLKEQWQSCSTKLVRTEEDLIKMGELEQKIKANCGFFNKHGRVKMITLRKIPSYGFLIGLDSLAKWKPEVKSLDLSKFILNEEMGIGMDFDTVCGEKFIEVYIPPIKETNQSRGQGKFNKWQKKLERFERISKEDFKYHYDTQQLNSNIWRINPDDNVCITVKKHGCVERSTIVDTKEFGEKTIGEIVDNKIDCHIKAFDIDTEKVIYVPIDNHYMIPNDGEWYEIELEDGKKITITGNNPVWLPIEQCYRR